ncbi:uncharacterized protein LOC119681515 [Teleopsis dalmanni]|uniref:uncharacterized protein LOC119681515 n=1 Tax=Teleopsis dalmanni TaxID=139649 RepID=UPI0018CC91F9|nr:uncharacterized protein LOC119681515 [Teleopsis dalmanni]
MSDKQKDQNFSQVLDDDNLIESNNDVLLQTIKMLLQNEKVLKTTHGAALTLDNEGDERFKYFPHVPLEKAINNYPIRTVLKAQQSKKSNRIRKNRPNMTQLQYPLNLQDFIINRDSMTLCKSAGNFKLNSSEQMDKNMENDFRISETNTISSCESNRKPLISILEETDKIDFVNSQEQQEFFEKTLIANQNNNSLLKAKRSKSFIMSNSKITKLYDEFIRDDTEDFNSPIRIRNTFLNKSLTKSENSSLSERNSGFLKAIAIIKKQCSFCKKNFRKLITEHIIERFEAIANKFFLRDLKVHIQHVSYGFIHLSLTDSISGLPVLCVITNNAGLQEATEFGLYDRFQVYQRTCDL